MSIMTSMFNHCRPRLWTGRYARVPGDTSVFHLRNVNGRMRVVIEWNIDDECATCAAVPCDTADVLAKAVEQGKLVAGGSGRGSFMINEFGQVLVPASDGDGRRYLVGQLKGSLLFENPFDEDEPIDLTDCSYLQPGDPWKLPYVGFPYNLNRRSQIYFYRLTDDGGESVYPPQQDIQLIQSFRRLRRWGPVRFLVTFGGLVLTKCPTEDDESSEESWQTFYVGTINKNKWFTMESGDA